ncbi:hypothetical protein B7494_g2339 [Chlorociboria aeruginascens]|nr:hypothetical protein B7494_g2339 [Chlorociboria aeruginascens]
MLQGQPKLIPNLLVVMNVSFVQVRKVVGFLNLSSLLDLSIPLRCSRNLACDPTVLFGHPHHPTSATLQRWGTPGQRASLLISPGFSCTGASQLPGQQVPPPNTTAGTVERELSRAVWYKTIAPCGESGLAEGSKTPLSRAHEDVSKIMNQSDAPVMQSYPSPNAIAADSGGPFYSSSNQPPPAMSNPEEFQLAAQLSRAAVPTANAASGGTMIGGQESRGQGNLNRQYEREQIHGTPGQAGQGDIDHMGSSFESPDGSTAPRKRSKVSRACDECRRKKIRCDATGENPDEQCSSCKRVGAQCQFSRVPMKRGPSKGYIKELADRLNTLEGAMQASDIPVGQYVQHHDGLPQRRSSDDASPPKDTENPQRKRTHSSVSGETFPPYQPQRTATTWNSQELPRHLPHPSQSASATSQTFREPNYSPNSIQPAPQWKKVPEILRRQSSSYDSTTQGDPSYIAEQTPEWDEAIINSYYSIIHPTYPILSYPKSRLNSRLANAPPSLKEAFLESLNAAVRSFSAPNIAQRERQGTKRVAQLVLAAHFDNPAVRNISTNLFYLQMMLFMAIEADNYGLSTTHAQVGPPKSAWLGSAVGLAYNMQLHLHKQPDKGSEDDPDSDDKLARRIWWSLVIMDRWHASSLSSPLLIPDSSVIVYPEDQTLLGDVLYHLARLSIVLGHLSAATLIPTDLPSLSIPPTSIVSTLLRGELERCRESFPRKFFPPSNAPIIHLCYWYLRILVELRLFESEPYDLLIPARHIVTQLTLNTSLVNPLTPHATVLAALTLIELLTADSTKEEAENGLNLLLESRIAPSGVDAAVKDLITKRLRSRRATSASNPSHTAASQHILTASQGLQRLADLATAEEGRANTSSDDRMEIETNVGATSPVYQSIRQMVKGGYMNILGN